MEFIKQKKNDPEPPPHLLQKFEDVVKNQTEKLRKGRKSSEQKAGKAKAMGINDTKLSKLAQQRSSYNKNKSKKQRSSNT